MTTLQDLLETPDIHLAHYPLMTLQDMYKLLYQGILGPEHLMAEPEAFTARLLADLEAVSPAADEPHDELPALDQMVAWLAQAGLIPLVMRDEPDHYLVVAGHHQDRIGDRTHA